MAISTNNISFSGVQSINDGKYNYNFYVNVPDSVNFTGSVVVSSDDINDKSGKELKEQVAQTIIDALSDNSDATTTTTTA